MLPFKPDPWLNYTGISDLCDDELVSCGNLHENLHNFQNFGDLDCFITNNELQTTTTATSTSIDSGDHSVLNLDFLYSGPSGQSEAPKVTLLDATLWKTLDYIGTEMMYTVQGRRIFPYLRFSIESLDPLCVFSLGLDLIDLTGKTFKFDRVTGRWMPKNTKQTCLPGHSGRIYIHPSSPKFGSQWNGSQEVSFEEVRIGRAPTSDVMFDKNKHENLFHVESGHLYLPRLHIFQHESSNNMKCIKSWTFEFNCLKFYASTHYRNQILSDYKILLNIHSTGLLNRRNITIDRKKFFLDLREKLHSDKEYEADCIKEDDVSLPNADGPLIREYTIPKIDS